jgi:hypothetical protein
MLRTLVALESDLASSIALRYACQMANIVGMALQTIHVEDADAEGHPPGTGWVRRSWEEALKRNGEEQIAQLIRAERSSCPSMPATKVVLGDRDEEILLELNRESYDLFVEGMLYTYSSTNFYKRIRSRLYRNASCPIILVKNLLDLSKIALVLDLAIDPSSAVRTFLKIFKGAGIDLDLLYFRFHNGGGTMRKEDSSPDGMLSYTRKLLAEGGQSPKSCRVIQGTPERLDELFRDYGLAVSSVHHVANKKSPLADLLYRIPSPLLLCSQ